MRVVEHPSAAALLAHAGSMLERSEAENGLVLGLLASPPATMTADPTWVSVDGAEGPIAVAMRTPPFNLLLALAPANAIEALVDALVARSAELPGVTGPAQPARVFAERWARACGVTATVTMEQGLYQLSKVAPPDPVAPGALRLAGTDDVDLVASWMAGFGGDARLPAHEREALRKSAAARVASAGLFMWEHEGAPVSMASLQGATRHGIRVSFVYTPPELRGRGYASACVAAVSDRALASGKRFCTLYTDLANPTSNSIYQRLGYRRIGESAMIAFGP
ncbi:MAG TPA: GNAT family N-acetyltransferase [Polyangiaceae bacterium]|nr:GNAT family N-acetyltransferase [Polyangiaceae bacterium]